MNRVLLLRRGADVEAREYDDGGSPVGVTRVAAEELAGFVREREATPVRWVWDDTTRWYPALLEAGVRVERCTDLRLAHAVLRRSPFVDQSLLVAGDTPGWDALHPVTVTEHALFPLDDPADRLDPVAEHERQQSAVAASAGQGRLGLLLAAESSGALVAAEMTSAGLPWRADVHERLLTDLLGPRPVPGARPPVLERLLAEIRAAFDAPALNPDSPGELLRTLQGAGLPVADTRSWTLEQLDHPGLPALLEFKKLTRLLTANGWAWLDTWVRDGRFRSWFLPGGVVTGRWASNGGGALSVPTQIRPAAVADEGWRLVVADVAQLEPRVLAGMSADAAMAEAARSTDLYEGMVASGAVASRADAKVGMLGAMYGGTRGESGRMMPRLARGSGARWSTRCSAEGHRSRPGSGRSAPSSSASRPTTAGPGRTGTVGAVRGAGSPATSSSRAPGPSGPSAGWPTSGTGCGASAGPGRSPSVRTWSSSCTTRCWCTPRSTWPNRWPWRSAPPRRRRAGSSSAPSPSTSRSTSRSSTPGPTPTDVRRPTGQAGRRCISSGAAAASGRAPGPVSGAPMRASSRALPTVTT